MAITHFTGERNFPAFSGPLFRKLTPTTSTTAAAETYTVAQLFSGLILRDPNGAARADLVPTAAALVGAIEGPEVGSSFEFVVRNTADAAETITLTANTGITLSGSMTIQQGNDKRFLVNVTSIARNLEAVTIYSLGATNPQTIDGPLTVNGSVSLPGATDAIAFGPVPATVAGSGNAELRFSNPLSAYFRNAGNTVDVSLFFADSSNNIQFGSSANSGETLLKGTNVTRIFTGANSMSWYGTYLRPDADNSYSLGLSSHRWSIGYLGTAVAIGTSPPAAGGLRMTGFAALKEVAAPSAPATDVANLWVQDNGAGKTQLMVQFQTGAAIQIAIEA